MEARSEQLDVLVVDADASVGGLLLAVLRRAGLRAAWVGEASTLFAVLCAPSAAAEAPRLLLTERSLPGCDVTQLQELLQERDLAIPLLVTTAYLEAEQRGELCDAPGIAGLLEKPFDLQRLGQDVLTALRLSGAPVSSAAGSSQLVSAHEHGRSEPRVAQAWFPGGSLGRRAKGPDHEANAC